MPLFDQQPLPATTPARRPLPVQPSPDALLDAVRSQAQPLERATALLRAARHLPATRLPDALQIVGQLDDDYARTHALTGLAPYLTDAVAPDALALAGTVKDPELRTAAQSGVFFVLSDQRKSDALAAVDDMPDERDRFATLAAFRDGIDTPELTHRALDIAERFRDRQRSSDAAVGLGPSLLRSPELQERALDLASGLDRNDRFSHVCGLLPNTNGTQTLRALDELRDLQASDKREPRGVDHGRRAHALGKALPFLEPKTAELLAQAADGYAREIADPAERLGLRGSLVAYLPADVGPQLADKLRAEARRIDDIADDRRGRSAVRTGPGDVERLVAARLPQPETARRPLPPIPSRPASIVNPRMLIEESAHARDTPPAQRASLGRSLPSVRADAPVKKRPGHGQ